MTQSIVYFNIYQSEIFTERKALIQIELNLNEANIKDTSGHVVNTIELVQQGGIVQNEYKKYTNKSGKDVPVIFASGNAFNEPEWVTINDSNRTHDKASYGYLNFLGDDAWYAKLNFTPNRTEKTRYANIYSTFAYLKSNTYTFIQSN